MRTKHWVRSAPLSVLALLVLGACSSSKDQPLDSQAIDGFIVKGSVKCDEEEAGVTAIAGRLTCPTNTVLVTVSGGWDVGFDETAETSDIVFTGVLRAPANLGYVTPLSTVAVQMASTAAGGYQADLWDRKVASLGIALGDSTLDLRKDPSDFDNSPELIRFNMQIHQVISAFARSQADYGLAIAAFATVMSNSAAAGKTVDLENNVEETMTAMNAGLTGSELHKELEQLGSSALTVAATNQEIDAYVIEGKPDTVAPGTAAPDTVAPGTVAPGTVAPGTAAPGTAAPGTAAPGTAAPGTAAPGTAAPGTAAPGTAAPGTAAPAVVNAAFTRSGVTIDRSAQSVTLTSAYNTVDISIDDFEDSTLSNGSYQTQVDSGLIQVGYNNEVLQFDKDLVNVQVTMGFELKSTDAGDSRGLSFYSDHIRMSATKGQSDSLVISLHDGATLNAVGTDSFGTITTAEVEVEAANTFSNENGQFSVNYSSIVDKLEDLGYEDIFANAAGNYEMTLIIGGIQLKEESDSGEVVPATGYDIFVGEQHRSGAGFKGYISYLD